MLLLRAPAAMLVLGSCPSFSTSDSSLLSGVTLHKRQPTISSGDEWADCCTSFFSARKKRAFKPQTGREEPYMHIAK